jgi:hypothetical protein
MRAREARAAGLAILVEHEPRFAVRVRGAFEQTQDAVRRSTDALALFTVAN